MKDCRLAVLAAACALAASPALAAETPPARQNAVDIVIPVPPAGKGQVVFFRKGGLAGAAVACTVHENGKKVSSLGGGRYVIVVTEPGRHQYSVKSEATDALALEVEPDETQFAACKIKMGIMIGRPDISPATEAEFRAVKSLKLVDADDIGEGALRLEQPVAAAATPAVSAADQPPAPADPAEDAPAPD